MTGKSMNPAFLMSPKTTFQLDKPQSIIGFTDLLKTLSTKSSDVYFEQNGSIFATQKKIQQLSYRAAVQCFSNDFNSAVVSDSMSIYLAKIDIDEVAQGFIDLSTPNRETILPAGYTIDQIYNENEKILAFLKSPFSEQIKSSELSESITQLFDKPFSFTNSDQIKKINHFLALHENLVQEVLLFCEVVGLICTSQGLYALCYQLSKSTIFAQILELLLLSGNPQKYSFAVELSKRYFLVYVGHLAVRVFSNQTLNQIEQALGER